MNNAFIVVNKNTIIHCLFMLDHSALTNVNEKECGFKNLFIYFKSLFYPFAIQLYSISIS